MEYSEIQARYKKFINKIKQMVSDTSIFKFSHAIDETLDHVCLRVDNLKDDLRYQFAVKYFATNHAFVVWNLERRREARIWANNLELKPVDKNKLYSESAIPVYRYMGGRGSQKIEKVMVVDEDALEDFFSSYSQYMSFNSFDENIEPGFQKIVQQEDQWKNEQTRKRYSSSQLHRDANFRKEVLRAYGKQCAICRCNILEVLQAAHEKGKEAANTDYDDPKHGICLCANHHLMYDNNLIEIDLNRLTIDCKGDERLLSSAWYQEFQNKFNGTIIKRKV